MKLIKWKAERLAQTKKCSNKDLHSGTENKQSEFQKHRIVVAKHGLAV